MAGVIERIDRQLIHKGVLIDYYKDTMKLPNGNEATWDMIIHKGAAACVAVDNDGKLVMVRQYRPALERETIEIPAGGLNEGEENDTQVAALRELEEETGYKAGKVEKLLTIYTTVAFCNEKIDIYLATDLSKTARHLDEDEDVDVEAFELDELLGMIRHGKIMDSKTICALQAYALSRLQ